MGIVGQAEQEEFNLVSYAEHWLHRRKDSGQFSGQTIRNNKQHVRRLREYAEQDKRFATEFDDITFRWFDGFVEWLYNQNLSQNTVSKTIADFKQIMQAAFDDEVSMNGIHTSKRVNVKWASSDKIHLNESELKKIARTEIPTDTLKRARDTMLIACYTGQRVSDWRKLNKENVREVDGVQYFTFRQKKGQKKEVWIPISPFVRSLMDQYDWEMPMGSEQKFNVAIKEVCKLAGIDQEVSILKHGKVKKVERVPKYTQISSHTARRSFITNAIQAGVNKDLLMKVTGNTPKTIDTYNKTTSQQAAIILSEDEFFRKNALRVV